MTDRTKFEQMLEHLINEDTDKAKELFHQLVVEKSREIYENILADDFNEAKEEDEEDEMDEAAEEDDEEQVDEASEEDEEDEMDESFGFAEGEDEIGGDPSDDMIDDIEAGDDEEGGDDMGGEGDLEDRVVDLEDALDELKAEFEQLMAGEEGEGHGDDMDMDMGDDESEDGEMPMDAGMELEASMDNFMREYVEKVSAPKGGDNGANAKSVVAGKNDMGGTTANIVKGGESTTGGTKGGLLNPTTKEENFGNVNVPGGNAGKTAFKKKEPGHGAEKKGAAPQDDKGADSPINGVKSRAK
jgi:hypothetical protein